MKEVKELITERSPVVTLLSKALHSPKPDDHGRLRITSETPTYDVRVSRACADRGVALIISLANALVSRDLIVNLTDTHGEWTTVNVHGEIYGLRLSEHFEVYHTGSPTRWMEITLYEVPWEGYGKWRKMWKDGSILGH